MGRNYLIIAGVVLFVILQIGISPLMADDIEAVLDSANGSSAFVVQDSAPATIASIDSDGNVVFEGGVRLDSGGTENTTAETFIVDGSITTPTIYLGAAGVTEQAIYLSGGTNSDLSIVDNGGNWFKFSVNGSDFKWYSDGTTMASNTMTLESDGDLDISHDCRVHGWLQAYSNVNFETDAQVFGKYDTGSLSIGNTKSDGGGVTVNLGWPTDGDTVNLNIANCTYNFTTLSSTGTTDITIDAIGDDVNIGTAAGSDPQKLHVFDGGADNKPGALVLYDDAGNAYYLWVATDGNLRGHTAYPTDDDTDGVAIVDLSP